MKHTLSPLRVFLAVTTSLATFALFASGSYRSVAYNLVCLTAVGATHYRARRVVDRDRSEWNAISLGMLLLAIANLIAAYTRHIRHRIPTLASPSGLVMVCAAVVLTAACARLIRGRAGADVGGVVDSAIVAVAAGSATWDFVLYPHMLATGVPRVDQFVALVQLLAMLAVAGMLARLGYRGHAGLASARALFTAAGFGIVGLVGTFLQAQPRAGAVPPWLFAVLMAAAIATGTAALHPSAATLSGAHAAIGVEHLSKRRLVFLGTTLLVHPLLNVWHQLTAHPTDSGLRTVSALFLAPLVMVRIGRLAAEHERSQAALAHQADHDGLTGLANRKAFMASLEQALARLRSGQIASLTVLFCDLDGFKAVNDQFGHGAGDALLVAIAQRLRGCVRGHDTVARMGGDEFVVLCEGASSVSGAPALLRRIRERVAEPVVIGRHAVRVGASVGIAESVDGSISADALVALADDGMYRAKRAGGAERSPDRSGKHVIETAV